MLSMRGSDLQNEGKIVEISLKKGLGGIVWQKRVNTEPKQKWNRLVIFRRRFFELYKEWVWAWKRSGFKMVVGQLVSNGMAVTGKLSNDKYIIKPSDNYELQKNIINWIESKALTEVENAWKITFLTSS